jgi:peptidoglycan hydrolase-like protein with peptidoglycan-binding domain
MGVRRLQEFLIAGGADLSPDGHFGPNTRAAILKWQHDHGLAQTGKFDPRTRDAFAAAGFFLRGPPSPTAQPGIDWPPVPA